MDKRRYSSHSFFGRGMVMPMDFFKDDNYFPSELQWLETMHSVFTAKAKYLERLAAQANKEKHPRAVLRLEGEARAYKHINGYFEDRIKSLKK